MEVNKELSCTFSELCSSLNEKDVQKMHFLLCIGHKDWQKPEPLSSTTLLQKMAKLRFWHVDSQHQSCDLSQVVCLLRDVGRDDLAQSVQCLGQYYLYFFLLEIAM